MWCNVLMCFCIQKREAIPLTGISKGINIKVWSQFKIRFSSGGFVVFHLWFCFSDSWGKDSLLYWHVSFWEVRNKLPKILLRVCFGMKDLKDDFLNLVCLSKDSIGKVLFCIGLLKVGSLRDFCCSGFFMVFVG